MKFKVEVEILRRQDGMPNGIKVTQHGRKLFESDWGWRPGANRGLAELCSSLIRNEAEVEPE
jgi:hypothetical protein